MSLNKPTPYNTKEIETWDEFDNIIQEMVFRNWIFRGHSDSQWLLQTSLYRLFEDLESIIKSSRGKGRDFAKDSHENAILKQFQTNAHIYLHHLPKEDDKAEWFAIMEHYGAPTRLLDMTFSPHIACFFALEKGHNDACIFAFNHREFTMADENELGKEYKLTLFKKSKKGRDSFFIPYEPKQSNERLKAQKGLFLIPSNNYETFDDILSEYHCCKEACIKIIIPNTLRLEGLKRLHKMNIASDVLFPGIDGFCRSLGQYSIYSNRILRPLR